MSIPTVKITAPPGARAIIIRGPDPAAVARAVRVAVGDGITLPPGPYQYPYAAIIQVLREADLFADPSSDTADNALVTREALCDLLWVVLRGGRRIGVTDAAAIDDASGRLLAGFAAIAGRAAGGGHPAAGLVIGAGNGLPACLQLTDAELRTIEGVPPPLPVLGHAAARVLAVMRGAPHPVAESSLVDAADIGARRTQEAMRELQAAELLDVRRRVALGARVFDLEAAALPWLETPEVRLPLARLAVQPDRVQARHIAQRAAAHGDYDICAWSIARSGLETTDDVLLAAHAAWHCGRPGVARTLADSLKPADLPPAAALGLSRLLALLAGMGMGSAQEAEAGLRAAERAGLAVAARPARARLLAVQGNPSAALTLLRRTTHAELRIAEPVVRLEHELAALYALRQLGDERSAARHLAAAEKLCVTRSQLRAAAEAGAGRDAAKLAARDFDAAALTGADAAELASALAELMGAP